MELIKKKQRVFWHELGHYVAAQLNKRCFGKYGTESFSIKKTIYENGIDYLGFHKPIAPPDYKPTDPIRHPTSYCSSLVYGCIFQCLYEKTGLSSCFDEERYMTHGFNDFKAFWYAADCFGLSEAERIQLNKTIYEYFKSLESDPDFIELYDVDIIDFIDKDDDEIFVDLSELSIRFNDFLNKHEKKYVAFVNNIQQVFQGHEYRDKYR